MKEALVSGLNEWLLNAKPDDRRYNEMKALKDLVEGAEDTDDLFMWVAEEMNKPRPVAKGFAFDFELTENQVQQIDWIAANTPANEVWRQVLKYLANQDAKITYAEGGGPYAPEEE